MKAMTKKTLALILTLAMVMPLFPATAYAYVGAMTHPGGVTAGQQDGYYYLKNDYIGFYIRPAGNLTTVPSQKTLGDVKSIGATETHVFYRQSGSEIWRTDFNTAAGVGSSSVIIDSADPANPKLSQTLTVSGRGTAMTITYQLVRLDAGAASGTTGMIIEEDPDDSGRTWGVLASASGNFPDLNTHELWMTRHVNFGSVGHSLPGTVRLDRYKTEYSNVYPYPSTDTHYSAPISSGLSRAGAYGISEAYTDSFSYSNQFVAMNGYIDASGPEGLISGIRGHGNNYASAVSYSPENNSQLSVEHEFSGDHEAYALWGFRDLYATGESNIPADPVSIATDATCVGIIDNNGTLSAYAAENEAALKSSYGSKLVAVFRGTFKQESSGFVFTNGAAQLSPALTATWTEGSGGLSVAANGTVTARNVHLSAPTFKFYKPKSNNDTSLSFSFSDGKLGVAIKPDNNGAILHIDIPGATCSVEGVTADLAGVLVFRGEMSISTPALDAANITMTRLGMGWNNNVFSLAGVEAAGAVDMKQLLGLDVGSASAEINSFPGEERYAFELELNVFDMFEAKGDLELKRISNGALIPNTLKLKAASEVGVPLVPPVVVAELNGLGGGFTGLADTVKGDFSAIPPLRLTVGAKGSVLQIIEGWYNIVIGPGYYEASLTDGKLLDMDIIDKYSWYTELAGDIRDYGGTTYQGLKVGGGMKIDLSIPNSDLPFIKAGGEFNASAFAGFDNYTDPARAYLVLGADGKIYGLVQIPAKAWFINRDLKLASAEVAFALGGQTTVAVNSASFEDAVKDAFGNISGYGGVAYTGSLIGFPYRIYYIFQDKHVGIKVGSWLGKLDPFDPSPYSASKVSLLDAETGEQVGIMAMNDNLTLLGTSRAEDTGLAPLSVGISNASGNGVSVTQTDENGRSYQVEIDDTAPDPGYLAFSLTPDASQGETVGSFVYGLTVQKSGEASPLGLVAAVFDSNGEITNSDTANMIVGDDCVTLKLPSKGTWTIASSAAPFNISCYYASPYASLTGMGLTGAALTGTAADMDSATNYILRTYLGTEKGGTDYLLSQSDVPSGGAINETLSLSGGAAPTGSYYVTTVLLEEISDDFDGDGSNESAYLTTDTFAFDTTVDYTNSEQPDPPADVTLTATGSELMRVRWKAPAAGPGVDGHYVRLYRQDGSDWTETGANYLLKSSDLTPDADGYYTYDMAVTVGDETLHLEADKTYRAGITAFRYLADEDGDGTNDSLPVESGETQSDGKYLPEATYPVLSYSPAPSSDGDSMKLLCINGATQITVTSDVVADIDVTRMDTDTAVARTLSPNTTLIFNTPADFTGALNLKITATDADGDITVDYIGLRLDDTAPLIALDSASFRAGRNTGAFTASGVTESRARVTVTDIITGDGTNGAGLGANEVTADENGAFTITGNLNPEDTVNELSAADSATLLLSASDAADNVSAGTFAQIVRAGMTSEGDGGSTPATGGSTPATPTYKATISGTNLSGTALPISVNMNVGSATVDLEAALAKDIFAGPGTAVLTIPPIAGITSYTLGIPAVSLSGLQGKGALTINTDVGSITVPPNMLTGVENADGDKARITIGKGDKSNLPEDVRNAIGDRPLVQLTLSIDGKQTDWNNPNAPVKVTIPYTTTVEELANPENIVVWYIDGSGKAVSVSNGRYDPATGTVTFFTTHFSDYAVAYVRKTFNDLGSVEWAKKAIEVMASKGITSGTGDGTTFSPNANITRADYMVSLINTLGLTAEFTRNFDDVKPGTSYYNAIGIAKKLGIAASSSNRFNPAESISRQDMMVLAARALEKYQGLKTADNSTALERFSDKGDIAEYAVRSLAALADAGLIEISGNKLNPRSYATRAEAVAFLYNIYNKYPEAPIIRASTISRLAGQNRIDTALTVAKATYPGKVATAVLATADNYPDALAGSVLAYKLNAPILLVGSSEADQEKVLDYLKSNLEPEGTVYILGGTGAIGQSFTDRLRAGKITNISRIGGNDRYETSAKISERLNIKTGTPIMLASGEDYPDALAVSSIAAQNQLPILLVQKDVISEAIAQRISAIKPSKVYIVGLEGAISKAVESQVTELTGFAAENIVRIGGADRYATSLAIAEYFNLGNQTICIATGNNFPDALAGSVYAAKANAPIILTDSTLPAQTAEYVESRKPAELAIFGGEAVVGKDIEQQIQQLLK